MKFILFITSLSISLVGLAQTPIGYYSDDSSGSLNYPDSLSNDGSPGKET